MSKQLPTWLLAFLTAMIVGPLLILLVAGVKSIIAPTSAAFFIIGVLLYSVFYNIYEKHREKR